MDKYDAWSVTDDEIVLKNVLDLEKVFDNLQNEENFIVSWNNETKKSSTVIIADNLSGKVKDGTFRLSSLEGK